MQTLVIRSLSNALVLPWPSKADNEQVREVNTIWLPLLKHSSDLYNSTVGELKLSLDVKFGVIFAANESCWLSSAFDV